MWYFLTHFLSSFFFVPFPPLCCTESGVLACIFFCPRAQGGSLHGSIILLYSQSVSLSRSL